MPTPSPICLVDNGSLRPAATFNLRRVAACLSERLCETVEPVSLLHSHKVDPARLEGEPARILEPWIESYLEQGTRSFRLLPYFIGPTGALTDYLPMRLGKLRAKWGAFAFQRANFLFPGEAIDDGIITRMLATRVRGLKEEKRLSLCPVVLVDHGSPRPEVTAVRDYLTKELAKALGDEVTSVHAASMECRPGPEYAFNEPLLERQLSLPPTDSGDVVVSLLFLGAGRHAGTAGDVAEICDTAESRQTGLKTYMTEALADDEEIVELLARRFEVAFGQGEAVKL